MLLAAVTTDPTTVLLWCGAVAVLLFAVAGGFFAGVVSAPWLQEWAIRRASKQLQKMYELVMVELERAQRMCAELATASGGRLTSADWQRLDRVQRGFQETFSQIAQASGVELQPKSDAEPAPERPREFTVNWVKTPHDPLSGLPDKRAFDLNLATMLGLGVDTQLESGLLLIRMDKADTLIRRVGSANVEKLLSRLVSLIVRSARDQDVVCRLSNDTLALLCPSMTPLAGSAVADKIREAVRNYHFRADETGPEVLVTASFGYANCAPGDTADLVRDRAGDGLARSQSLGRNQLHVHDGQLRALCRS